MGCVRVRRGDYGFTIVVRLLRSDGSMYEIPDGSLPYFVVLFDDNEGRIEGKWTDDGRAAFIVPEGFFDVDAGRYRAFLEVVIPGQYRESSLEICVEVYD